MKKETLELICWGQICVCAIQIAFCKFGWYLVRFPNPLDFQVRWGPFLLIPSQFQDQIIRPQYLIIFREIRIRRQQVFELFLQFHLSYSNSIVELFHAKVILPVSGWVWTGELHEPVGCGQCQPDWIHGWEIFYLFKHISKTFGENVHMFRKYVPICVNLQRKFLDGRPPQIVLDRKWIEQHRMPKAALSLSPGLPRTVLQLTLAPLLHLTFPLRCNNMVLHEKFHHNGRCWNCSI